MKKMFTVKEVSYYLRVSQVTLYKLISAKKIGFLKVGGQWNITRDALQSYIDKMNTHNRFYDFKVVHNL